MYGNRAPEVSAGPSHLDRQRGFQEKGKYGQACNKKREGSCICVTGVSLKIFGELMAESSLWHLQLAGPSGCYKMLLPWGRIQAVQHWGIHTAVSEQGLAELQHKLQTVTFPTSGVLHNHAFRDISNTHR